MGLLDGIFGGGSQDITTKVKLPKWYTDAAQDLIKTGNNAGSWYASPYMGNTVAALTPLQQQVISGLQSNIGSTNAGYATAQQGMQRAMNYSPQMVGSSYGGSNVTAGQQAYGYQPQNVSGGSFLEGNVNSYMDPYIDNVERQAMGRLEDQRRQAQNTNADMAIRSGAFGSSRHGVVEATTNAESAKAAGDLSAGLRSQAYNNARELQGQDLARSMQAQQANQQAGMSNAQFGANIGLQNIGNNLNAQQFNANMGYNAAQMQQQAALANQQAGLSGAQMNMAASGAMGDLTAAQQAAYLQSLQSGLQGGGMQQQYNQQLLNQTADQYNAMRQYPIDLYNMQISALAGLQLPQSQSTTGGGGLASGIMGGLGGALTGAELFGAGGALAGVGGLGAGAGAIGGGLLGLLGGLSDEDEKTNIEKLGEDEETGLSIYAYDYKADVKAAKKGKRPMPMKRVGPMAQEIEEKFPGSTRRVGGKLVVSNLGFGG